VPRLRVGFVSTYPPIHCGVGEYTKLLATALASSNEVDVFILAEESVGRGSFDGYSGAAVIPSFRRADEQSFDRVLDALADVGGVDVLHIQHEYGIFGRGIGIIEKALEAREEGLARRVVFTLHTVYHSEASGEARAFQRRVVEASDAVIVHSNLQEHELQMEVGGYPSNLHRIPHGTSLNPYLDTPRRALAGSLGLEPDSLRGLVVSVIGFLRRDKGIDTLLEALDTIESGRHRLSRPLTVIVAGEPRDPALLESLRIHEGGTLRLMARYLSTPEILKLSALSDAIVLPYRDAPGIYSVSGILHLSMGSLKPVIGTNTPRLTELYTLAPRLVIRAGDSEALARMLSLLSDPDYYELTVAYAGPLYSYAVRTSWSRMARRHLRLYNKLLAQGRP